MKIVAAIPAYDRKITCATAHALLNEQGVAAAAGIELQVIFAPGSPYVHTARDQVVKEFLKTDAARMVFVDSDVAWEPGALIKLARNPVPFVGGAYRFKRELEGYPVEWLDRPLLYTDPTTGLLEVSALPGGFLAVDRSVFDQLREAHPGRRYAHEGHEFHAYFHCPPGAGEDGTFCAEWRATGGQVWLDPELTLTHVDGGASYTGHIGNWLRNRQ